MNIRLDETGILFPYTQVSLVIYGSGWVPRRASSLRVGFHPQRQRQHSTAPHRTRPEGRAALRCVLIAVTRVSQSLKLRAPSLRLAPNTTVYTFLRTPIPLLSLLYSHRSWDLAGRYTMLVRPRVCFRHDLPSLSLSQPPLPPSPPSHTHR